MPSDPSAALDYLAAHRQRHRDDLIALLRIPSVSTDPAHQADVRACAGWLAAHLRDIGLPTVEVLPTAGHPVVYAEWLGAPGRPTVLIYGHYDVQPAEPLELWATPPFEPTIRDGQIYARGATDDKGQFFTHVKAVEALLATAGRLPVNVKFLIEGEEEIGSVNLAPVIEQYRDRLAADVAVVSDTPMSGRGQPSLCYGLRGLVYLEITVTTAGRDLHSGQYGGAVPNPILALAHLLSACKTPDGRITVPGFYDEVAPLTPAERESLAALPFDEAALRRDLELAALPGEPGYTTLERLTARPTLDANGIWGGFTGAGSKTVIPCQAHAKLSCRLVPDQDPAVIAGRIEAHLHAACPPGARVAVRRLGLAEPVLTPLDHPATQAAARALEAAYGVAPFFTREGGSIPVVATFRRLLNLPTVLVGFGLPDEPLHAPNERFDLDNYERGACTSVLLLHELAALAADD
jgi:acetylornithine deacetylase/succinyl-diaminopimelate desuccinylase-like protein